MLGPCEFPKQNLRNLNINAKKLGKNREKILKRGRCFRVMTFSFCRKNINVYPVKGIFIVFHPLKEYLGAYRSGSNSN